MLFSSLWAHSSLYVVVWVGQTRHPAAPACTSQRESQESAFGTAWLSSAPCPLSPADVQGSWKPVSSLKPHKTPLRVMRDSRFNTARWACGWPAVIESHACVNMAAVRWVISGVFGHPEHSPSTKSVFSTRGKRFGAIVGRAWKVTSEKSSMVARL